MRAIFGERGLKISFISIILLPSLILMGMNGSSMAAGLMIAVSSVILVTLLILCISPRSLYISPPVAIWISFALSLIIIHYFASRLLVSIPQDGMRFIGSIAILLILFVGALIIASSLCQLSQISVRRVVCFIFHILVVNTILSLTGVDYFGVGTNKPTFLFSEPSHFALIVAPFLIYYVRSRLIGWRWTLLLFLTYAILIENMTMMMAVLLALVTGFRLGKLVLILPILLIFIYTFASAEYFTSRIIFMSNTTDNLSMLVFLQGWDNAFQSLLETKGWGVGFQQFGISSISGEVTEKIMILNSGGQLNLLDGGTTAAKILGEFGFIGALLISILIMRAFKAFLLLTNEGLPADLFLFASCVDLAILIELFVRGAGYFTPSIFMYLVMFFCPRIVKPSTLPFDEAIKRIV